MLNKHIKQYKFKDQNQETLGASSNTVVPKAMYSMKMEILVLFDGNEDFLKLAALELYSRARRTARWQIYW